MSSIDILKNNLKKIDIDNIVRFVTDLMVSNIEDIQDYDTNSNYNKDQRVYVLDMLTNKHMVYRCKVDGTTGVFNINNWDIVNIIDTVYLEEQLLPKADVSYVDEQISTVTATGIPKLVSYDYIIPAITDGQTIFTIPLANFNNTTDTIRVHKNTTFVSPDKYTTTSAIDSPQTNGFITLTDLTLISSVTTDTIFVITILKNVPIGPTGAINGEVIAIRSLPQNRVEGFNNLSTFPPVGLNEAVCIVNNKWYQSNGTEWIPMDEITSVDSIQTEVDDHISNTTQYSTYKINKDINGIYTEVQHKRLDGTLILKSILSGATSPTYSTRTETLYELDGITIKSTRAYTLSYDSDGAIISEV